MMDWVQRQSIGVRIGIAIAYCGGFYALLFLLGQSFNDIVTIAFVTVFPFFYGTAVQLVFDPQVKRSFGKVLSNGLVPVGVLCVVLLLIRVETMICVVILLPIFVALMALGMVIMRKFLPRDTLLYDSSTFKVSLLMAPVLALPLLGQIDFPDTEYTATTLIEISAPRAAVWDNTYAIAPIQKDERVWTRSHSLLRAPVPIDATVSGSVRQLRWSQGIRFQEHLSAVVQNQYLAWNFVFNESETLRSFDPHVSPQGGIVNLHSGSYSLRDLPNGHTELALHTHYRLNTPVNGYLALWGEFFLQDFHRAVLSVIKTRSEAQ